MAARHVVVDQPIADQVPKGFRTIGLAIAGHERIEARDQLFGDSQAHSLQLGHAAACFDGIRPLRRRD